MIFSFGPLWKRWTGALLLFIVGGSLCPGPTASTALAQQSSEASSESKYGGNVTYGESSSVTTFNPYQITEPRGVSDRLFSLIYNGLVHYDYQQEKLIPALAVNWTVKKKAITFHLRKNVQWHDGELFTAEDVAFTFRYILQAGSNKSARERAAALVKSVEASSRHTVTFQLSRSSSNIAREFSGFWIIPKHRFNDQMLPNEKNKPLRDAPTGTGPYKFVERTLDGKVKLEAFQQYWDGKAYIAKTQMKRIYDPTVMFQQALGGGIQMIIETPPKQIGRLKESGKFKFEVSPSLAFDAFAYDNSHPVLGKKTVRRALTHAVDRKALLKNFYAGKGQVLGGPVVPQQGYYNPDVRTLKYDPEKARSLLRKAGYVDRDGDGVRDTPEGTSLSFDVITLVPEAASSTVNLNVAKSYTSYLKEVGIEASVAPRPKEKYQQIVFGGEDFNIAWVRWEFDPSYDISTLFMSSETGSGSDNIVNYKNKKIDRIFRRFATASDPQKRRDLIYEAQKIISEDLPYTFLYTIQDYTAINYKIIYTKIDPYYFFSYYDEWYISPAFR